MNQVQALLFSATWEENVLKFAKSIIKDPNIITLKREEESLDAIKQLQVETVDEQAKLTSLFNIYATLGAGQMIIFCRTRETAKKVATTMHAQGYAVSLLSGALEAQERARVLKRFQQGLERVLVSTNLTSRGIDVEQVTLVVNFDLPDKKCEETNKWIP